MSRDLFGEIPVKEIPMMPESYYGTIGKGCGYTKSNPRKWTDGEVAWITRMRDDGYSNEEIGISTNRTVVSIQIKLKRLGKRNDTYNENHLRDKYACNAEFYHELNPKSILDLYCGLKSYWEHNTDDDVEVVTNDKDENIAATFHEDAEMLIHKLYYEGYKFDLIDLDPYGSAYECFDLAVKMAQKGLIVTFGELGHKRWKRLDFVSRYYGIEKMEDFTLKTLFDELNKIALRNKKRLIPIISRVWDRIGRVWLRIEDVKITEQWDN